MALIFPDGSYTTNIYPKAGSPARKPVAGRPGQGGKIGVTGGSFRTATDGSPVSTRPVGGPNRKPVAGRPAKGATPVGPSRGGNQIDKVRGKLAKDGVKGLKPAERAEKFSKRAENLSGRSEKLGERSKTKTGAKAANLSNRSKKLGERAAKFSKKADQIKTNIAKRKGRSGKV